MRLIVGNATRSIITLVVLDRPSVDSDGLVVGRLIKVAFSQLIHIAVRIDIRHPASAIMNTFIRHNKQRRALSFTFYSVGRAY